MKLKIEIQMDNAAFEPDYVEEVQSILEDLCERLPYPLKETNGDLNLRDTNGNTVGKAAVTS